MNDKTREQIEAMKMQTIGVEVEMNNITREKAARKVAEFFGTTAWYAAGEYGYHMLNLHATFTKGTIEFRLFQFADPSDGKQNGLHAGELKAYIQLCLAMSQLAKMVKTASPKPQQTDNEKYAMRCWMLRLGFIGDEFKTAREILLRNMEGNASWRNA